jgi:leader peptidase (prepilin peptidase)/N-methyltransferase
MIQIVFYCAVLFLIGVSIGSFLNVCVYRLPQDKPLVLGRSHCPHCGEEISIRDNIPLVSYVLLGGRCRHCGDRISPGYPFWELVTGLIFVLGGYLWLLQPVPDFLNFLVFTVFILVCLTVSRIDFAESIIPNELNYSFFLLGLLLGPFTHFPLTYRSSGSFDPQQLWLVGSGVLIGGGLFFLLAVISPLFYGKPALGMGDVKLMAAMGAWLGPRLILMTIMLGSVIGALIGTAIMFFQGRSLRTEIPFGPFLCIGGILSLLFGHDIFYWYIGLL